MPTVTLAPAAGVAHLDPAILNNTMNLRTAIATLAQCNKVFDRFRRQIGEQLHDQDAGQYFAIFGQRYVAIVALKII